MKLALRSIIEPGELAKERLTFRSTATLELGEYFVTQTKFSNGMPTTEIMRSFWFPDKRIEEGDLVVLYTKDGSDSMRQLKSGNHAHFYYLSLTSPIWNTSEAGAVLMFAPTWDAQLSTDLIK